MRILIFSIMVIAFVLLIPVNVFAESQADGAILVKIFGDKFDFSTSAYQEKSNAIRFENLNEDVIHRYTSNATIENLFESIGLGFNDTCFVFLDGRSFCSNNDYDLKFFVNEQEFSSIKDYVIQDNDRILISYSSFYGDESLWRTTEFDELNKIQIVNGYKDLSQYMGFYENKKYEFSFEAPTNWNYQESVSITEERIDEVIFFPSEFHISNAGDDANMIDMQTAMMGWQWQFESPKIGMDYENIPTSKIKTMNENNIKDYYLDFVREVIPSAKMVDIYSKTHNYGWEVGVTYYYDQDLGIGQTIPYVGIDKAFFFEDREKYTLYYGAPEVYFDEYKPVYDHAVDTLIIKSVAVPEFGSVVMLILASSVISVVILSRKYGVVK
ncbi:MAG: PEFG-CTERM sorting domain-containing protein [Candidatus Nitrosopelagicus sp.]|nr:PEFG-CTERM sorting domain-containing protein [Candidatus Nitrosopelagicus sp.]